MGRSTEKKNNEVANQAWYNYQDLEINTKLFKMGVIVIKPYGKQIETVEGSLNDESSFFIGSRKLFFSQIATIINQSSKKKTIAATLKKTTLLLDKLQNYTETDNKFEEKRDLIIANSARREEVFFPFSVKNNQQNFGFYIYPWLSTNNTNDIKNFTFSGFKRFSTAGCMFGSTLKGIDQLEARLDLIKHDIKFHKEQKISTIDFNPKASNPYEEVMFNELDKLMLLINHLSDKSNPSQLYYHLPHYDYMLFGIELFIRGRMELVALEQFFKAIILKTVEHLNRIEEICKRHLINCIIGSPFENLFGRLKFQGSDGSDLKLRDIAKIITEDPKKINIFEMILPALGTLGIEPNNELGELDELNPEQKTAQEKVQEKLLVQHCLRKLQDNNFNLRHKQVWNDFIKFSDKEINTLDDLFRTANAIVVLLSCQGEENYKVCSILPFSEKQIQVSYAAFYGKSNGKYPVIVNITTIEPVLSYDHNRQGLLFYYGSCPDSLSRLITEGDILTAAHENIARTVENKESIAIEQVLTMLKKFKL
jgi:hypothetical protein